MMDFYQKNNKEIIKVFLMQQLELQKKKGFSNYGMELALILLDLLLLLWDN